MSIGRGTATLTLDSNADDSTQLFCEHPDMNKLKLAAAVVVALAAAPVMAADTWIGTANYGAGAETVGPFNTYDFSSGGVLLIKPTSSLTSANGYYQSFVSNHLLDGIEVANPALDAKHYEITVVANFTSQLLPSTPNSNTYQVTGGSFSLWLDKTPDHKFSTDTGFNDSIEIMKGSVVSGGGSNYIMGTQQFGGGALQLAVTSYDSSIYSPATIGGGDSIFTLRLGAKVDKAFLDPITSVQGNMVGTDGLKFAADGNLVLTPVPEPESYAMLLAGLGLIGAVARRRAAR